MNFQWMALSKGIYTEIVIHGKRTCVLAFPCRCNSKINETHRFWIKFVTKRNSRLHINFEFEIHVLPI